MSRISKDHLYLWFEHNINIDTKTLYLGFGNADNDHDIDESLAANILKGLHVLSRVRPDDPINIVLNCTGGDVHHGFAIYDSILSIPGPVHITVTGHCYSMAAWVLQAGDKRMMTRNSNLMIHYGEGPYTDFDKQCDVRLFDILFNRIREKNPEFTRSRLDKLLLKDTYMWPEEALDMGLIDEIIE